MIVCKNCGKEIFMKNPNPFGTTNEQPRPLFTWWHVKNKQGLVSVSCDNDINELNAIPGEL